MPSLGFQPWKADILEANESNQTMRPLRKGGKQIQVGDKLYLFRNFRTKRVKYLKVKNCLYDKRGKPYVICKSVEKILIRESYVFTNAKLIFINDIYMDNRLYNRFAKEDGFNNAISMIDFFEKQYGLPFEGVLIKW